VQLRANLDGRGVRSRGPQAVDAVRFLFGGSETDTSLFIKGTLPGTGEPFPMLVLLGIAAVVLGAVAGIVVLRRS
jgi:LPXTG-motif cell wall-anchored protein